MSASTITGPWQAIPATSAFTAPRIPVTFSKFLPRYSVYVVDGRIVAGSPDAIYYQMFRENKRVRPRIRGLRNPSIRGGKRTDFGRLFVGRPPMVILDDDWL